MATVFLSKPVRHVHTAKPSLLRPLFWALGLQAALGGVLVMIHEKVDIGEGEVFSGGVTMNFVEQGDGSDVDRPVASSTRPVKVSPPIVIPVRMEEKLDHREILLLATNETPIPEGVPVREENGEIFLSNDDFGVLLSAKEGRSLVNGQLSAKSEKQVKKGLSSSRAAAMASSSPESKSSVVSTSARYKSVPLPPYPHSARSAGREGVVMLKLLINEEGKPVKVYLAKSSGSSILDDAALAWVKDNWLFYPATDATGPVESAMIAPLRFKLNS